MPDNRTLFLVHQPFGAFFGRLPLDRANKEAIEGQTVKIVDLFLDGFCKVSAYFLA